MKLIQLCGKDYQIPETWNELTSDQLVEIMEVSYVKKYDPLVLLLRLFKIMAGIKISKWKKIPAEQIDELLYLVSFLFEENTGFTKQLIPCYEGLQGPSDGITNMLMGEFTFSEHYYMKWQEEKTSDELLNHFVGIIYRPAKKRYDFNLNPDGDCREKFNENICAWRSENIISKWPKNIKLAIASWYGGCRQKLVDDNPEVFGGSGEPAKYGLIEVMMNIAKEGTHGDFESVENKSVHLMLIHLNINIEDGKKQEAAIKDIK
jgi:hypothetical protein